MKARDILSALLLLLVCAGTCAVSSCSKNDAEENEPAEYKSDGSSNGHMYVDLALPSGTLWATCNVGANRPEEYGSYFAWGETKPKDKYSLETYVFFGGYKSNGRLVLLKYCTDSGYGSVDGKNELEPEDDAATANWGKKWQTPSKEQLEELIDENNITTEWTTLNGVNGLKIISRRNGKSVFLPAAGINESGSTSLYVEYKMGYYMSRMSKKNTEMYVLFADDTPKVDYDTWRWEGHSVRPVRKQ